MINFDREFQSIIDASKDKKVLLHSCCAPCASACLEKLQGTETVCYYFNPNIMPFEEYEKRGAAMDILCRRFDVELIKADYDNGEFLTARKGLEDAPEGGERCHKCFSLRLYKAAEYAKANGFDFFATSLTLSPRKDCVVINRIGFEIAAIVGTEYLPSDFKKREGYKRSIELSKELGLYRQSYCGCI